MSYIPGLIERLRRRHGHAKSHVQVSRPAAGSRPLLIRMARDADLPRLWDLAELDSAAALRGPALVALIDEEVWAAVSLSDGRAIADPFRPTAQALTLLHVRAAQLAGRSTSTRPAVRQRLAWRCARA